MVHMKVVVMAFAMILMLVGMSASVQAQSETRLVGEWHFDEGSGNVAKDSSGNGYDGIIHGASWVDGKFGKALSFNGVNEYVDTGKILSEVTNSFTMELWVNPSSTHEIYPETTSGTAGVSGQKYAIWPAHGDLEFGSGNSGAGISIGTNGVSVYEHAGDYMPAILVWQRELSGWTHIVVVYNNKQPFLYVNGNFVREGMTSSKIVHPSIGGLGGGPYGSFKGIIDEVRIYNRALSADEIKAHYEGKQTALTLTKTASPYSIKQGQTTTITLTIKNTGTTDIANIEIMDSIHRNFDLIGGDFPNPRKFDIIGKGESREIQYMIKAKEGGTFNLDPATGIYADKDGNIQEAKSEPFSVKVITYFEPNPIKTSAPASTPEPTTNTVKTASVSLYGEKTDVVLGEDILLKLSAVNLITKPMMHVQVIIIPPSGMSVTSSEFSKIAAGQFTANYELPPGDGRDIEVSIKSNQVGDFNVNGRIIYYFGDEKGTAEDHNLNLPIKVRREAGQTVAAPTPIPTTSGFEGEVAIIGLLYVALFIRREKYE